MRKIEVIKSYYDNNFKSASKDFEILGWESEEAQNMRFEVLVDNIVIENKKLLDIGCGLGNLLEYLNQSSIQTDYIGVDVLQDMINLANKKDLNGKFICTDIFKEDIFPDKSFDIIYSSGIFNLNLGNNLEFLREAISKFLRLSRGYIAFNLLHINSSSKESAYYYFDPKEVISMISQTEGFSSININIAEHYLSNDFTVICRL